MSTAIYEGLDHVAALARTTRAFLLRCALGTTTDTERDQFRKR